MAEILRIDFFNSRESAGVTNPSNDGSVQVGMPASKQSLMLSITAVLVRMSSVKKVHYRFTLTLLY